MSGFFVWYETSISAPNFPSCTEGILNFLSSPTFDVSTAALSPAGFASSAAGATSAAHKLFVQINAVPNNKENNNFFFINPTQSSEFLT